MSSETEHKLVPYESGTPEGWEEAVNALPWEEVRSNVFRKVGRCPMCNGEFTCEVEMVFPLVPKDTVRYCCKCTFEHPNNDGKSGRGAWGNVAEPKVL